MKIKIQKPLQKTRDKESTELKLLSAAEDIFALHGFKGATVRLISKKAGINLALINRYFEGKFGLLLALLEKKVATFKELELAYPPQESVTAELAKYAHFVLNNHIQKQSFVKIVMVQFLTDQKFLKKYRERGFLHVSNAGLKIRLKTLIREKKMVDTYPVDEIIDTVEKFAISLFLSEHIIHGLPEKEIHAKFLQFIKVYGSALETKKNP